MNKNSFFKYILLVLSITSLVSCDNDSNEIGANMVGEDHFGVTPDIYNVIAYNQATDVVETTSLPVNQLGIYDNPVFGKTTAHFVTQVQLETQNPTINLALHPEVVSVTLTIPYYSTLLETKPDGTSKYQLDSIYGPLGTDGNPSSKIALSVFESKKFMSNLDTNGEQERFYSNQFNDFNVDLGNRLNDGPVAENDEFFFSPDELEETTIDNDQTESTVKVSPRMKLALNTDFFQQKLFTTAATGNLVNNNAFKNYFKGLLFRVAQSGSEPGNLAMLNFANGKIVVKYKQWSSTDADHTLVDQQMVLKFTGKTANLLQQEDNPEYTSAISSPDKAHGDKKLYLRGSKGSMSVIQLFRDQFQLDSIKEVNKNWLVNDASLSFYIQRQADLDGDGMDKLGALGKADEPNRIYLYDLDNKRPLIDYYADQSTSNSAKYAKGIHGGIIEKSEDARGTRYKIRITNHIRNIFSRDSTNVRLGLVVTEGIGTISNVKLLNPFAVQNTGGFLNLPATKDIQQVPIMSVANPFGTILWGSNIPAGDPGYDKRLKFEVYYTKPNN